MADHDDYIPLKQSDPVRESLREMLREYIAERDCFYECHTDAQGRFLDGRDKKECERMDAVIDRARAALGLSTPAQNGEAA